MFRRMTVAITALALWLVPAVAIAQDTEPAGPNLNWVFQLAVVILVGFVLFLAFVGLYYALAVVARNRRFATQTPATTSRPAPARAPEPAGVAAQAPAQPAAQAQPAPAEAPTQAPAQPQAAPAPETPEQPAAAAPAAEAPAPAATGGLPKIDPNNLPDGIDAVMRGRLKKLSVLQERGQEPPADLVEELKPVLEQIAGGPIDATAAPAQEAAPAQQAAPTQEAPAEQAEAPAPAAERAPAAEPAEPEPAADTGGLPRIDPNNLPDGIDAVARGRLKKLAIFQERGQAPPAELVENLKPILDQMSG